MSVVKRGYNGKLYVNTSTHGSPVWVAIDNLKDAKVNANMDKTEATTRAGGGLKQYHPTLFDPGFSAKIRTDDSDTAGYVALETAFFARATIDVMMLDGDKTVNGNRGIRWDANVFKWEESQGNDEVDFRDFELAPAISTNVAQLVIIAGAVPTYATIGP